MARFDRPPLVHSVVLRSIASQTAAAGFNAGVSVLLLLLLARWLGPDAFAMYSAVLSGAVLALVAIEGGWSTLLFRDGSGDARMAPERIALAVGHVLAACATGAALLALLWIWLPDELSTALAAALLCMCMVALTGLVTSRLRAQGAFDRDALWQISVRLGSAGAIVALAHVLTPSPALVFVAWAAALAVLLSVWGGRQLSWPRLHGWRTSLASTLPFVAYDAGFIALTRADVALLGLLGAGREGLTDYAAGARLNEGWLLLFTPVAAVLLRSFRLSLAAPERAARLLRMAVLAAFACGLAASALAAWQGPRLLALVFGDDYQRAGELAAYTSLMLPFALPNLVAFSALIARGQEALLVRILLAGAVLLLPCMAGGLWLGGPAGAALGLAATHALVLVACLSLLRRRAPATSAIPDAVDARDGRSSDPARQPDLPAAQQVLLGFAPMNARSALAEPVSSTPRSDRARLAVVPDAAHAPRLLLLMPAFNEQDSIAAVVAAARAAVPADVLVVSDDSTDATAERARAAGARVMRMPLRSGAWIATQAGLRWAQRQGYSHVLTLDADGQHDPSHFPRMLDALQTREADLVIGIFPERHSALRKLAGRWFRLLTGLKVEDLTSGMRIYGPRALLAATAPEATLLDYQDLGVLLLCRQAGLSIHEVEAPMRPRSSGRSHVFSSWRKVLAYMLETTALCLASGVPRLRLPQRRAGRRA